MYSTWKSSDSSDTHTQHLCKIKVGYQKLHHKWAIRIQKQQPNAN